MSLTLLTPFVTNSYKIINPQRFLVKSIKNQVRQSTQVYQSKSNDIPKQRNLSPVYKPKTFNQTKYVSYLNNPTTSIVLGVGPAGSGKTLFACITAIDLLKKGKIDKIILTRPIVPVEEEELGFLPGNLINKMDPWTKPIMDILSEFYTPNDLNLMFKNNVIEVTPLAYMRGRTFKNSFIIADEMQNSTPNQMLMLTTRIGTNSKMVITGDLKQSDRQVDNGLLDLMNRIKAQESKNNTNLLIKMIELSESDIERSEIVKYMLEIYEGTKSGEPTVPPETPSLKETNSTKPKLSNFNLSYGKYVNQNSVDNDAAMIPKNDYKKEGKSTKWWDQ